LMQNIQRAMVVRVSENLISFLLSLEQRERFSKHFLNLYDDANR